MKSSLQCSSSRAGGGPCVGPGQDTEQRTPCTVTRLYNCPHVQAPAEIWTMHTQGIISTYLHNIYTISTYLHNAGSGPAQVRSQARHWPASFVLNIFGENEVCVETIVGQQCQCVFCSTLPISWSSSAPSPPPPRCPSADRRPPWSRCWSRRGVGT